MNYQWHTTDLLQFKQSINSFFKQKMLATWAQTYLDWAPFLFRSVVVAVSIDSSV